MQTCRQRHDQSIDSAPLTPSPHNLLTGVSLTLLAARLADDAYADGDALLCVGSRRLIEGGRCGANLDVDVTRLALGAGARRRAVSNGWIEEQEGDLLEL